MSKKHLITVADGDGIGPEIMEAALHVLQEAGAQIEIEKVVIGEKLYLSGHPTGIEESAWDSLRKTKVFLKAPITTPQGGGYRSLNVTIRGALGLYANVRPCASYSPFVQTKHPNMDLVIIRENEEDLYTGIEYQQTPEVCQALKLISRPGSEKICRYAFEYARRFGRKKVTCFTKDNILKLSDGLFHKVFEEIGEEYPDIEKEHWIIDIGSAKLADTPEAFDVVVLPNLYGDILSDIAAQISGSVGLAGSANIGEKGAMFEAIHGSAPRRAGQNIANPSGLMLASVLMLLHIHQPDVATRIHNAWLKTIEEGIHTNDIYNEKTSREKVGTLEFAKAVSQRLGQKPDTLTAVNYETGAKEEWAHHGSKPISTKRELIGVDFYFYSHDPVETLAQKVQELPTSPLKLTRITNRGSEVWPAGFPETFCVDHFRCRFLADGPIKPQTIASLYHRLADSGLDVIQTANLYTFDGHPSFSK
ncbi:MAG: Isocitrate dehydrogenase [NADP] [Chlamydiae bacterium]|nr:Isocitrate dehydrogenase [NADP] [Chlamydiota bacterium]